MSADIIQESTFFLHSVLTGIMMIFAYDVLRILRRVIKHGTIIIAVQDFIYWVAAGIVFFQLFYQENNGTIRWYSIGGIAFGMLIYNMTISGIVVKWISFLLCRLIKLLAKIFGFVGSPVIKLSKKAGHIFSGIGRSIKNIFKIIKRVLKKFLKTVKISLTKR